MLNMLFYLFDIKEIINKIFYMKVIYDRDYNLDGIIFAKYLLKIKYI